MEILAAFSPIFFWVGIETLVLSLVCSYLGWRAMRKQFEKDSVLDSRLMFAFRILALSQIVFFGLLVGFILITAGFGLFVVPLFVFCNILSAVTIFVLGWLQYTAAKKWVVKDKSDPLMVRSFGAKDILLGLSAFLIPIIMFVALNGSGVMDEMLDAVQQSTGSTVLVELQAKFATKEYRKDALYSKLAFLKKDPSICEHVSQTNKTECVAYSDLEILDPDTCSIRKKLEGQYAALFEGRVRASCLREAEGQKSTNLPTFVPQGYLLVADSEAVKQNPHLLKTWRIAKEYDEDTNTVIQLLKWDFAACAADSNRCSLAYDPVTDECRAASADSGETYSAKEGIYGISICKAARSYTDYAGSASVSAVMAEKSTESLYMVVLTQWGTADTKPSIAAMEILLTEFIRQWAGQ